MVSDKPLGRQLRRFSGAVRAEIPRLLAAYQAVTDAGTVCYVDQPGRPRRIRPWCDAIEIGAMFGLVPGGMSRDEWVAALRGFQEPVTGLVPEHIPDDARLNAPRAAEPRYEDRYNTMIVNYALECLGSHLAHPVTNAEDLDSGLLQETLGSLSWNDESWGAGHWVDTYASCLCVNRKYFARGRQIEALFIWLDAACDPETGMWGKWREKDRWLQPVNGFYRLTRGTYAQFGRPLPHPESAIDTILTHVSDRACFSEGHGNACNVLDMVHPLWLCLKTSDHRKEEASAWMADRLPDILARWQDHGFAFDPAFDEGSQGEASLQGTEMWLSIVYLMADVLGLADCLAYRPRGVHRLEMALKNHTSVPE